MLLHVARQTPIHPSKPYESPSWESLFSYISSSIPVKSSCLSTVCILYFYEHVRHILIVYAHPHRPLRLGDMLHVQVIGAFACLSIHLLTCLLFSV